MTQKYFYIPVLLDIRLCSKDILYNYMPKNPSLC